MREPGICLKIPEQKIIWIVGLGKKDMSRVCTYLNFPGNTEEVFNFYKQVFGGEFCGGRIERFRDMPVPEGVPKPYTEADADLIMHIELPLLGGHILMGSDAPVSRGFHIAAGNNFHLYLEPETREETVRLFNALSEGGMTGMPLQNTFWGAYYGTCTDKFGIQWMLSCQAK